jgi:hypothetical protein
MLLFQDEANALHLDTSAEQMLNVASHIFCSMDSPPAVVIFGMNRRTTEVGCGLINILD